MLSLSLACCQCSQELVVHRMLVVPVSGLSFDRRFDFFLIVADFEWVILGSKIVFLRDRLNKKVRFFYQLCEEVSTPSFPP